MQKEPTVTTFLTIYTVLMITAVAVIFLMATGYEAVIVVMIILFLFYLCLVAKPGH